MTSRELLLFRKLIVEVRAAHQHSDINYTSLYAFDWMLDLLDALAALDGSGETS